MARAAVRSAARTMPFPPFEKKETFSRHRACGFRDDTIPPIPTIHHISLLTRPFTVRQNDQTTKDTD